MAKKDKNSLLNIHYSRTLTPDNLSKAANYVGEHILKGLGAFGKFLNAGFTSPTYGTTGQVSYARNTEDAKRLRELSEASEQAMGKAMTWVSPLNYGAAVWNGHGLDARKGEEEVASWSPAWLAVGRLGELYVGPKAVKGIKSAPKAVVNTAAKAGVKPAKAAIVAREINKGIKQNTNKGRIEVTGNYFNSPDKWYRITETPEKYGIMELGKNVTTHDAPQTPGTINGWRSSMLKAPITKSSEGFIKRPQKIDINIRRKNGQAHGNTSQAAKGKLWGGTTSGSNLFPEGIIEGQAPSMINYGIDRTNFVMTPWELVPNGGRVGFHTGEMPMSNLGWFQRTNKGTYTYEPIIPEKRASYQPKLLLEPSTSLAFFERKPSREYVQSPKDITSDVGDLIAEGSERSVYASKSNPNIVYKIEDGNAPLEDINNIKIRSEINDDIMAPETTIGYYKHKNGKYYRVTQQDKYKSYNPDNYYEEVSPELNLEIIKTLEKAGWKVNIKNGLAATASKNGVTIGNLEHFNWGRDSKGNLKLVDLYVAERNPSTIQISPEELYKVLKDQELNGYYFMGHGTGRTNVNPLIIFDNGLRIKNGDIGNTTSPISLSSLSLWPHANSKEVIILPGKAENVKFDSARGRIPSDWYDSKTFQWDDNPGFEGSGLFAALKPNATFVETEINGVPGVYTKPEAVLGSYNIDTQTLKLNPKSQYKFFKKQGGKMNIIKLFKKGGQIRKMLTAAGGPINYKRWDNAKTTSYTIPFIKEKAIKLTNAGRATGAVLSTNLLDSLANNAMRAGVPVKTAIGISTKETTLGNPTDTKSAWNLSSGIRREFNGIYPGTYLHINPGRGLNERELVINYHKGHLSDTNTLGKSVIQEALEFYKQHPDKYNTNQSNYQNLVNIIGEEVMNSPEILKWYREWEKSKALIFRPEPYKINTNIQNTALEFIPFKKQGGRVRKMQTAAGGPITRYETLPNIEVVGYRPIELKTYKPLHKEYPFTGHSSLDIPIDEDTAYTQGLYSPYVISVDKTSLSKDYNLITNNCADATLGALNYIFGTKEKPLLFTTPGDVRDYAINKLHGKVTRDKDGIDTILIPRNKNNAKEISRKALEWRKNKDEDTIYEFEYKQGGKMNILEFLKNGSGIHIKKKNRGKFTSYCGGKVTDECIRKAKASGNPTLVKRATFALNARRWKHKEGGIIKALEGTKTNFFLKAGNFLNSDLGKSLSNTLITGIIAANKADKVAESQNQALDSELKSFKIKTWADKYKEALSKLNNRSSIINKHNAYEQANSETAGAITEKELEVFKQQLINQQKANQVLSDAWSLIISNLAGTAANALLLNGVPTSTNNNSSITNNLNFSLTGYEPYKSGYVDLFGNSSIGIGGLQFDKNFNLVLKPLNYYNV